MVEILREVVKQFLNQNPSSIEQRESLEKYEEVEVDTEIVDD